MLAMLLPATNPSIALPVFHYIAAATLTDYDATLAREKKTLILTNTDHNLQRYRDTSSTPKQAYKLQLVENSFRTSARPQDGRFQRILRAMFLARQG